MDDWLSALVAQTAPAVLITVLEAHGSVPRKAGARMLVNAGAQFDTIGGGHLEHEACELARTMLKEDSAPRQERFALGPRLGQCCGGAVVLAFEIIRPGQQDAIAALQREVEQARQHWPQLMLFGAGHVGTALVRALDGLPCRVTWVDTRDAQFPQHVPENTIIECTDTPEALIAAAAPGTSFLVMTHSHALDQQLTEHILKRPPSGWFGLIGSQTKRMQFEHRLRDRGVAADRIASMVCPIGLPGISGKEPAVIAAAVTAQLLQVWETQSSSESLNPS
jgi:xanthine dehydrogenase accessory factor